MSETRLCVRLLDHTPRAVALIYAACRQCYSAQSASTLFKAAGGDGARQAAFIRKVVASGHESPLEHAKFTFGIEGVSRALTHQLVRHRIASFCLTGDTIIKGARQKSRRYKKFTLKSLYERTLKPHGRSRLKLIRLQCYDEKGKIFDKGKIKNVVFTGKQDVWRVTLANGQNIKATLNHRFLTKVGWLSLKEIMPSRPALGVNGIVCRHPAFVALRDKDWMHDRYRIRKQMQTEIAREIGCSFHTVRVWIRKHGLQKEIGGLHGHASPRGTRWTLGRKRTQEERAAVSERMKGPNNHRWQGGITREAVALRKAITSEARRSIYERDGFRCRLCHGIGGKLTLHHRVPIYVDKTRAGDPSNLVTLCRKCHHKLNNHETEYEHVFGTGPKPHHPRSSGCYRTIKWAGIKRIVFCGPEDTYDIEMEEPHHNFVANGFVVHNSQQSQRYVKETSFDYVVPPSITRDPELREEFVRTMEYIQERYNSLLDKFKARGKVGERAFEDARFVLPQAAETKIVVTMNARELLHFFRHRCCARAQWEIKRLAAEMLRLARKELPEVFEAAGAKCTDLKYCPEGAAFSCGRYPLKEDVLTKGRRRRRRR